ncbi:MAG: TlpA disulfide reductase family protein [Blastocatellia bacterium]|nr:TlpA disulfide reductase family protein [Blastocatellia bacterium]
MSSPNNQAKKKSGWSITKIGLVGSAVLLIAAIGSALYNKKEAPKPIEELPGRASASRPAATPPPELAPAVLQAQFNTIDGKAKKLSDYSGKVLIVDLWATWCGPCRQEIPHLIAIANEYKSKGVEVLGLTNEDPTEDAQKVRDFSKQFKINYPVGWATPQIQVGLMRGRNGIPQTLIIGRDGKVRNHFVGFSAPISVPQMKAALEQAVAST